MEALHFTAAKSALLCELSRPFLSCEGAQEVKPASEGMALRVLTISFLNYFPS